MSGDEKDVALRMPALREDLQIMEGAREADGAARWVIFDPLRHRYFQIDQKSFEILQVRDQDDASQICSRLVHHDVSPTDIEALIRFLYANSLTLDPPDGDIKNYAAQAQASGKSFLSTAVHKYMFIRIPLIRPHAFLKKTAPLTSVFFTRQWWICVGVVALAGFYLASRQWDYFVQTFLHFFNFQGLVFYACALIFVKVAHELGHAYAATRYGCRVTTMGVAFLVMFPVLFTDTTDAWRLTSRRKRLIITAAGVIAELTIAVFATLFWAFLPDGPWRSAAFFIATTAWIMSLAVNLNPLMRFDGYHFLSDLIGVHNLQARSFALGRWALREALFDLNDPVPETMATSRRHGLVALAWATWVYRFFLFLGIALLVHAIFFKALGIVLFWVEIGFFILLPIFNELKEWNQRREVIYKSRRTRITITGAAALGLLFVVPFGTTVHIPAVLEAEKQTTVYAHQSAQIVDVLVKNGDRVNLGDVLLRLESPMLDQEISQANRRISLGRAKLDRIAADAGDLDQKIVLQQELQQALAELSALEDTADNLTVTAPIAGTATDIARNLHAGRWINSALPLVRVVSMDSGRIRGYVSSEDLLRINAGAKATFIPQNAERGRIAATVVSVNAANATAISISALTSRYGGSIAVSAQMDNAAPLRSWYSVVAAPSGEDLGSRMVVRGWLHAKGEPESLAIKVWRQTLRIGVRETTL